MKRELKFRDYDLETKQIRYFDLDHYDKNEHDCYGNITQFTGLFDKNQKPIYEGDIVRILYTDWGSKSNTDKRTLEQYLIDIASIGEIVFNEDRFCVKIESKKYSDFNYSSIFAGNHGYIEVIGNIYETV